MDTIDADMDSCDQVLEESFQTPLPSTNETQPTTIILDDDAEDKGIKKRKKRERKAPVWQYYILNEKTKKATCVYCGIVKPACSVNNGTTGLKTHIINCHKNSNKADAKQKLLVFDKLDTVTNNGGGAVTNLTAKCFNVEACRNSLARMVIKDELPFRLVEGEGFKEYSKQLEPRFIIPSRITVARDVWNIFLLEKKKMKLLIARSCHRVSLTTDTWSSLQNINYMALTAHFIDNDWKLHKKILNFCQVENHKGETMAREIEKALREWNIKQVFSITVDNASSNDVGVGLLRKKLVRDRRCVMNGELMHMRCVAHIINLIVTSGLKDVHDSIVAIRNCVKYVKSSPARLKIFDEFAERDYPNHKAGLSMDVSTRWNSTYLMLESALKYMLTFDQMVADDLDFRAYFNDKDGESKRIGPPSDIDWENARVFVKFLESFYHVTNRISGSLYVTSNNYFTEICDMQINLRKWADRECVDDGHSILQSMAVLMKAKYDKYWGNVDRMNKLLYVAAVLDPRYKLDYIKFSFRLIYTDNHIFESLVNGAKSTMVDLYEFYCTNDNSQSLVASASSQVMKEAEKHTASIAYAFECLKEKQDHLKNQNELDVYLSDPKVSGKQVGFDVLSWWKGNTTKYPILSQIARDILAVPVSTVASESAFSTGGRILDPFRSSLAPKMVEGLICCQNWIRSSYVSLDLPRQVEDLSYDPDAPDNDYHFCDALERIGLMLISTWRNYFMFNYYLRTEIKDLCSC